MKANLSSIQTKIIPIIFGLALFFVAFSATKGMVRGNITNVKMLAGLIVVAGITLALDKYYWLMLPAFFVLGIKVPGLPLAGPELGCALISAIYVCRLMLQKEITKKICTPLLVVLPLIIWIFLVWCINPTGLAIFGSTTIGARFYIKIVLGLLTAAVMCTKSINEQDAKKLFLVIVIAQIIQSFISLFAYSFISNSEEGVESSSRYQYLFALAIYTLMFCKFGLTEIFKSGLKFFIVVFFALLTIYTGKRRAIGTLLFLPLLRFFFTGKEKFLTFCCIFIAAFILVFTISADGVFYELPYSVKRSFSVVVPKYRQSDVVQDVFRYELRKRGNEIIKDSPWFGRKGYAMDFREAIWIQTEKQFDSYEGQVYAGNWHSTWYGYACDFGLPSAFMFGVALIYMLIYSYKSLNKKKYGSWAFVCTLWFTFDIYLSAIFSYTSGHSSLTTFTFLYNLGMLVALENGSKQDLAYQKI